MRLITYKAGDAADHKKVGDYLRTLPEGTEFIIEVKKNRPIRSLSANKFYHAILKIIAIHTGHTHEELHEALKMKFNSDMINFPKSGTQLIAKSTSDLDSKEFGAYINRVKNWALNEFGIVIPEAKDIDYEKWISIENEYERVNSGY